MCVWVHIFHVVFSFPDELVTDSGITSLILAILTPYLGLFWTRHAPNTMFLFFFWWTSRLPVLAAL